MPSKKKLAIPKTLGACIDLLYTTREKRLALESEAADVKSNETKIKDHLIATFGKSEMEGARGKVASVSIGSRLVPAVKDWDEVYKYVKKKGAWDLLQKRMSDVAFRERLEAGEEIPGVESFNAVTVSCTKLGAKK